MRDYHARLEKYGISKWEYYELKAFCRQYDIKRRRAEDVVNLHGQDLSGDVHGTGTPSDPVAAAAARREPLLRDINAIETAAAQTGGGGWEYAVIENCCRGVSYDVLPKEKLPSSKRTTFFEARREFFWRLKQIRESTYSE